MRAVLPPLLVSLSQESILRGPWPQFIAMKKAILYASVTIMAIWATWAVFLKLGTLKPNIVVPVMFNMEQGTQEWYPDITFLETSGRTCITGRQACAIESAQLHNPSCRVRLLTTVPMNTSCKFYDIIGGLSNFESRVVHLDAEFHGTPLESWYLRSGWNASQYRVVHLSDALRYLVLWKNGGIYLDLDFIILNSLTNMRNGAVYQAPDEPANGMLFFDRGHPFLLEILNSIAKRYDKDVFHCIGPSLLKEIYSQLCHTSECLGVTMYPVKFAYPVPWKDWEKYFDPKLTPSILETSKEGNAVHFWNYLSSQRVVRTSDGSAYDVLAKKHCPTVYDVMNAHGTF